MGLKGEDFTEGEICPPKIDLLFDKIFLKVYNDYHYQIQ